MADGGHEACLDPLCLLSRQQLRLHAFIIHDPTGDAKEQLVHDKDKDAAPEQNPGHHQIRLSKDPHHQIADEEQDKEDDGNVQDRISALPGRAALRKTGVPDKARYAQDHHGGAQIHKQMNNQIKHVSSSLRILSFSLSLRLLPGRNLMGGFTRLPWLSPIHK